MVVNKRNARDPNGDETHLLEQVTLSFADEVEVLQRLNRRTGKVEDVVLQDPKFVFYLPGGTGELFKCKSDRPFAGIAE
ncbi:MAG: hypothetical protein GY851_33675, partial [bacterium]|nr:hypothetical protein [bacterium]